MTEPGSLKLFLTPAFECGYFSGREASNTVVDPTATLTPQIYGELLDIGFRRSGDHVYRPRCPGCDACIPVRVPASAFTPSRSQRRNLRLNAGLRTIPKAPTFEDEHFALYRAYQHVRHPGGGMDNPQAEDYRRFLFCDWAETLLVEFRDEDRLVGVAVCDLVPRGISAVYTWFDPAESRRGIGTLAVLWQIEQARRRGQPWVYLGYWISGHDKMDYKTRFRPIEEYRGNHWERLGRPTVVPGGPAQEIRHPSP
ncbi:MAG: arginyltransferase [Pseudomonadota bacterium]|nr:arginyltransferase [Pseudomonadota bacterium]